MSDHPLKGTVSDLSVIDNAELWVDPLDDLVHRTAVDPGAPFSPDSLETLLDLKHADPARFENIRARLKAAGCRVGALDKAITGPSEESAGGRQKQADILIGLASAADLFHSPDGTPMADVELNGHRETWPLRMKGFKRWLSRRYFEATGGAPNGEALQSALNVLEAKAHFDGPERRVCVRIGSFEGRLYLDLGDDTWRAVEVDASGWRVVDRPPVRFRRSAGSQPLPLPRRGGSIAALRAFLNVRSDDDFVLVVAWILACLRDRGPYPLLVLSGEQGSAKSTFSAMLRALLDPNTAPLRALPREDRDLFIAATNAHLLTFDNVSVLPGWLSDTLCRLSTGGGFAVRQLYTDQDEVLFDATRPIILNGIEDIVTRPDLADRAIFLTLQAIPEARRRPETELWAAFNASRGLLLGALLDAVAGGLRLVAETKLPGYPRMADFALWVSACERSLWAPGAFWNAYTGNRSDAVDTVLEADSVGGAVRALMMTRSEWSGTASDLLLALGEVVGDRVAKSRTWPESAKALSGQLRRSATFLRQVGVECAFSREGRARTRIIRLTAVGFGAPAGEGREASVASAPSNQPDRLPIEEDDGAGDGGSPSASTSAEVRNPSAYRDDADATDAAAAADSGSQYHPAVAQCCEEGALKLSCRLCSRSATYWRHATGQ